MRIALLTNFIPPYRKALFLNLQKRVDDLRIILSTDMERNRSWKVDHEALNVSVQKSLSYSKTWQTEEGYEEQAQIHVAYDTISQLSRHKPDVVISAELGARSLLASLYCKLYNKPLILWLTLSKRTEAHKKGVRISLRKYLLKSADAVLCNGKSCEGYVADLGFDKRSFYVPYTSDYQALKHGKKKVNNPRKIFYSGQLIDRKGIKQMVATIYAFANENPQIEFELLVAGDGPERACFTTLDECLNVRYSLLGNRPYEELHALYQSADLYLFPTLADEWGVVVNEALAMGTPVIGSLYSQAVEQLIEVNENGWIFRPDHESEFVEALNAALTCSDDDLMKMSQNCLASIENYTPEKVSETIKQAAEYVLQLSRG